MLSCKSSLLITCAAVAGFAAISRAQDVPAEQPLAPPPAAAAPAAPPPTTIGNQNAQGVASVVNDYLISEYDVSQRVALFIATSGIREAPTGEAMVQIRQQVLHALEDETLQLAEAAKHKLAISKDDIDRAVQQVSNDNNMTPEQLTGTLRQGGVSMITFRKQIAAQIAWQRVVESHPLARSVQVSDEQINAALSRLKDGADKPQFQVAEIFLAVDNPQDDEKVKAEADQILQQLSLGASFPNVARQFSRSASAASGGNIGWVQQGQLAPDIDKVLGVLQPGQVSTPIKAEGGYYIMLVIDRREPAGAAPVAAPALDPDGPLPLDRLLLPLAPETPPEVMQQAIAFAQSLRAGIRSCADLPAVAARAPGAQYFRLGEMRAADLSMELGDAVRKTGPGGVTEPVVSGAGVELLVRCDPAVREVKPFVMPTREEIQQQLFVQRLTVLARSLMRDLRRDAVVETR